MRPHVASVRRQEFAKAATPFHALINYEYAILETEATIALQAHGFDPGLGILHTDKRYRGSFAHDLMEPVRRVVDGLVLDLLVEHPLERGDVYETARVSVVSDRRYLAG
jgi:CRISP-associated protein Cas1